MQRDFFLAIMETEACRRYMAAHQACVAKNNSVFVRGTTQYPPASHWDDLEQFRSKVEREKKRHERWLKLRLMNANQQTSRA